MTAIPLNCWSVTDQKVIRQQLDRILKSGPFLQSRRKRQFLEYVVTETLAGRGERLKGYNVALEVFGRPGTFDPVVDPIVRVEASRLRAKLHEYYRADGRSDLIRIELPKGTYTPHIEFRRKLPGAGAPRLNPAPPEALRIGRERPRNSEAHEALLCGLERFWHYSREACAEAQGHFARAVQLDPLCANAHAWLARTHVWLSCMNWVPDPKSTMEHAIKHARRSVELDDQSSFAHAILGWVRLFLKDGENAVSEGHKACALDPNSADAKLFLSLILAATGHGKEALRNIETAMLLQPHPSSFYFNGLGLCHFALADYKRAIAAFLRGIEINPSFMPNHYELAIAYGVCGRADAALTEAAIVKADCPNVAKSFFLHPPLRTVWLRGRQVAGLV